MDNQVKISFLSNIIHKLEKWFLLPFYPLDNISGRRQAQLTAALSIVTFLVNIIGLATIFATTKPNLLLVLLLGGLNLLFVVAYVLGRAQFYKIGSFILTGGLSAAGYIFAFSLSIQDSASVSGSITSTIPIALVLGGALLGIWGNLALTLANFLMTFMLPRFIPAYSLSTAGQDAGTIFTIGMLAMVLASYRNSTEKMNLRESQITAQELQLANRNLEKSRDELEARTLELQVANSHNSRRAAQLESISRISESIAAIHDLQSLLPQIAKTIGEEFGFEHVGIFLIDEAKENAVLKAANSEGGQLMLAENFKIRVASHGLVGYVSEYGVPRMALDSGENAVTFDDPRLPSIHSEVTIPLLIDQQVIGVLDIQSNERSAFSEEDLKILSSLGNQIAIVIQNAKQFEDASRALADARTIYGQYLENALGQMEAEKRFGYRLSGSALSSLETPLENHEIQTVANKGERLVTTGTLTGDSSALTVPIKLRDEIIGVLDVRIPEQHGWNEDEIDVVEALAERVALAVENATLLEETQRRALKERVIGEITSKISSSINMRNVLQTAVEELGRAIPGSDVIIQFQNSIETGR